MQAPVLLNELALLHAAAGEPLQLQSMAFELRSLIQAVLNPWFACFCGQLCWWPRWLRATG